MLDLKNHISLCKKERVKAMCYFIRSREASGDKANLLHLCLESDVYIIVLRERRSGKAEDFSQVIFLKKFI